MTLLDIVGTVAEYVQTHLVENQSYTVVFDNENVDSNQSEHARQQQSPFIICSIRTTQRLRRHVTNETGYKQTGLLLFAILVEGGNGDRTALQMAEACMEKGVFANVTVDGVTYETPQCDMIGITRSGWWQVNVTVPFFVYIE